MYLQELPTTGEIIFSDFLLASSSNLVSELSRATELRTRIRALLKANRRDDATHSTRDWLQIVKATEEYLPHLFAIHNCLQTDDIILKYDAEFSWRSCFSASLIGPPPRIAIRGIHYELVSTLLLSGTSLSNLATSIIAALGPSYERDRLLSSADRKAKDDKLKMAADMLCRAAGIFDYIASSLIPAWENAAGYIDPRPPETTAELAALCPSWRWPTLRRSPFANYSRPPSHSPKIQSRPVHLCQKVILHLRCSPNSISKLAPCTSRQSSWLDYLARNAQAAAVREGALGHRLRRAYPLGRVHQGV